MWPCNMGAQTLTLTLLSPFGNMARGCFTWPVRKLWVSCVFLFLPTLLLSLSKYLPLSNNLE